MLPAMDRITLNINVCINVFSIIMNGILMWIIIIHTPRKMRTFSVLLLSTNICDMVISISALATNHKMITISHAIIFNAYGPCKYFSVGTCFFLQKIHFHFLIHTLIAQFLAFSYRYYILVRTRIPTKTMLACLCLLVFAPTFALLMIHFIEHCPNADLLQMMKEKYPNKSFEEFLVYGYTDWRTPSVLASLIYLALPTIPLYVLISVLKRRIEDVLERRRRLMKRTSRLIHKQLLQVLTLLSYTPFLMTFAIAFFVISQLSEVVNSIIDGHLIATFTDLYPLLNAIITIRYIGPYRRAFNHIFWTKRDRHSDRYVAMQYPHEKSHPHSRRSSHHSHSHIHAPISTI